MANLRNAILSGIAFGLPFGLISGFLSGISIGLITGTISGSLFGFGLLSFALLVNKNVDLENEDGLINKGLVNLFHGKEAIGGILFLFRDRLHFKSHSVNSINEIIEEEIKIENIREIRFCFTSMIIPNGIKIITNYNRTYQFVVNERKKWKALIEELRTT